MDDVPIASIIENPKSAVRIAIKNIPPPTPKRPEENPTKRPIIPAVTKLNGILASSLSLLILTILFTVMNNNKRPNIISKTLEGSADATNPPIAPPIIPKTPNLIPVLYNIIHCTGVPISATQGSWNYNSQTGSKRYQNCQIRLYSNVLQQKVLQGND